MPWTKIKDMHSGGGTKINGYENIYIEAHPDSAEEIFRERFDRDPHHVTCECCGPDFNVQMSKSTLEQASGYERNCRHLKTPRDENGRYMNGLSEIQNQFYLEPGDEPPEGFEMSDSPVYGEYIPIEEYIERDDVLIIRESDIDE